MENKSTVSYHKTLLTILLFTIISTTKSQTLTCDILVAGISIGTLSASKVSDAEKSMYSIDSNVNFWFFGRVFIDYQLKTSYENGILVHSYSKTKTNRGDYSSTVKWSDDYYQVDAKSYKFENSESIFTKILFSTSRMYFEEPINQQQFLAENFGIVSALVKKKDYYEVHVNGNVNKFYYENGQFVKAIMQSPIKNYVILKK
ncbi:DUF6134 family protein [Mongoliitalea lutea]|nr:DUF6134 family protein [Mongoliitalea lutea]